MEYALRGTSQPVAVARYTCDALPPEMRTLLPSPEEVLEAIDEPDPE